MLTTLLLAAAFALPNAEFQVLTETKTGFATATSINSTPETEIIRMSGPAGHYRRVSFVMEIVWGTTATLNVKCKYSGDGTNYGWIQRCTSAATHDCGDRVWQWVAADGTTPTLDLEVNYPYLVCQFDDPGAGNGTIQVHTIKSK